MNHFIEYVCRGVIHSEDAIRRLNKSVTKLAKRVSKTNTSVLCLGIASLMMWSVVATQDKEIKMLKKQVSDLAKDKESVDSVSSDAVNDTEEQKDQEGA